MLDDYSGLGGCHSRISDRWTATQAAPKAPQRKRSCRSRALSLILDCSFVELRVREPRPGARSILLPSSGRPVAAETREGGARFQRNRPAAGKVKPTAVTEG